MPIPEFKQFYDNPVPLNERPPGCLSCPHNGPRVGSRGPKDSPIVIVGESPGSNELTKGYPFIGDSGELMLRTMEKLGWTRDDPEPLFLNALQCLPRAKNEVGVLPRATASCQGRLMDEIREYPRRIVIAMGNPAIWACTNDYKLKSTQDRGRIYPMQGSELGVLITVHPAFLLRQGTHYAHWKRDLDYAISLFKGTDPKEGLWKPPVWSVISNRTEYEQVVAKYARAKLKCGDIETGGPNGAGLDYQRGYIISLGVTSEQSGGRHVDIIPSDALWGCEDLTKTLLEDPQGKWLWQNGKFDIKFFRQEGIHARVDEDLMLMSYCMNENKGHDLDTIAWDWIGAPKHKDAIEHWFKANGIPKKRWDYGLVPKDILYQYQAYDISKTFMAGRTLREAIEADPKCELLYTKTLIPASEFLTQMEMEGLELDLERAKENDVYYQEKIDAEDHEVQQYALQHTGHTINIGSYKQLGDLLYGSMKLGVVGSSTDDDALTKIQRRFDHPIVNYIKRWRTASKARNTYVKNAPSWLSPDGRVHVTFKLHGTSTGRLSSGQPTNLQNWPRVPQVRGQFIAGKGRIFGSTDLNQAELRCLALMSGDPTLMAIYSDPSAPSIHHITSVALFGEGYTDDEKMRGKAVNFGIVYGRTPPSFAEEFNVSLREATDYIRAWLARYPVAAKFIEACRDAPSKQINLVTNFGRKKRWGVVSSMNVVPSENEAANFPHQSTAHDITLHSGIECQPVVKKIWGGAFVNEIHDDIMSRWEDNIEVYGPGLAYVQSVMMRKPKEWGLTQVPFLAECKVGVRWGAKRNAKEAGETNEDKLAEYMTDFVPTEDHKETARRLLYDNGFRDWTIP